MGLAVVHNPVFQANFPDGKRFPMAKSGVIAELLVEAGIVPQDGFHLPGAAGIEWIGLAHDRGYVEQVFSAKVPDAIARQIGFLIDAMVASRARHAGSAAVLAARLAMEHGIACTTAGGGHHAKRAHGAGYCVFNDVAVAANVLLAEGEIGTALIFDCDVHQGDGTAEIFRDEARVATVSIHAQRNFPTRKEQSDIDVGLPDGTGDEDYLEALEDTLERAMGLTSPDIVFYNGGVDPHRDDRLGRLALSDEGLAERDRRVIGFFRELGIPVAGFTGGGYGTDVREIAARHLSLHRAAVDFAD